MEITANTVEKGGPPERIGGVPLLDVRNLSVSYGVGDAAVPLIDGVSFTLEEGAVLVIAGGSGSGKTLLCRALTNLFSQPEAFRVEGDVLLRGKHLSGGKANGWGEVRRSLIRYVFQEPLLALNPVATIASQMRLAAGHSIPSREEMEATLVRVGIPEPNRVLRSYPHQLSAGLAQRVMIAMAILASPALLIADEPTSALDAPLRRTLLDVLSSLQRERGMGMVLVTHDLSAVRSYGDTLLLMFGGRVVEYSPCREFFETPLHPYGRHLVQAMSDRGLDDATLTTPSQPVELPDKGCAYAGACTEKQAICSDEMPRLEPAGLAKGVRCHFWR